MKIGVSSYSFDKLIRSGAETQLSVMKKAAEMGFEGIEFTDLKAPEGVSESSYAELIRGESERLSLPVISYTVSANLLGENGLDAEVERVRRKVDVAATLGVKVMRHDAAWAPPADKKGYVGFEQVLPTLVEGCRRITEYAASKGIETTIENHGHFCQDSDRVERIITGVGSPNFGLLLDIGNFSCVDEDNCVAVGRVARYAKHVHAKDFHIKSGNGFKPVKGFETTRAGNFIRGAIIGHGNVPVAQCLSVLKDNGYNGFVSVEFEGLEDCIDGISIGYENLKSMISSL